MVNAIDELGKYTPMEPHRSYPVVFVTPERIAALEEENRQLKEYLESLTPRGSEFHNDPERCVAWVRERLSGVVEQVKKRKVAETEVERLRLACIDALGTIELLDLGAIDDPIVYTLVVNTRFFLRAALEPPP